ncbi:hypothetical protein [Streptomyces racemochromogenes]|uniref:WXG100 family type VII secretion target n=1 Tax=Streptomyces racemochromogenes TaxID=67353 RepID=UPI0031E6AF5D
MATTNFEGYSHEQLLAMIASVNPETVKARATQLAEAATVIKEIGSALKKHQVKGWEGEAAHAFQEWVSRAGNATLLLGDYSEAGGKWMTQAAQTMIEVKANTPKYDTSAAENLDAAHKFHNDPDAQQLGRTAHTKLTADHQQAVQQLTKLAQSYEQSSAEMNKATVPTFPAPPPDFEPTGFGDEKVRERPGAFSGGAGEFSGESSYESAGSAGGLPQGYGQPADNQPLRVHPTLPSEGQVLSPLPVMPSRDVNVGIDHLATLPDSPLPPIAVPVGAGEGGNGPRFSAPSLPMPPVIGTPGLGGGSLPVGRPPGGIGGKVGGIAVPPPRDTGIVGGRPIATGGSSAGIHRGTVIGADGPHAGGRPMPGMMGGGLSAPHGTPGGQATGRRLAMEPGGVVGGRQAVTGGQAFTQGGAGVVRGSGAGAVGHGGTVSPAAGRQRGGQVGRRPGYLAEDEETWQGNRRVVPPVID